MKNVKWFLGLMFMFSLLLTSAQNPLPWSNGNFPIKNYLIDPGKNSSWYAQGDSIYSIFKVNEKYYASGVKWSKSSMGFAMAFANDGEVPTLVQNGFLPDDVIYWGRCRKGVITQINLISTYKGKLGECAVFAETEHILTVEDNPYYSLDPIWPVLTDLKIEVPTYKKAMTFTQLMDLNKITPKWTEGWYTPELSGTNAKLKLAKNRDGKIFLNACTIRFSKDDVAQRYFFLKIIANPLPNSTSPYKEQVYRIHW